MNRRHFITATTGALAAPTLAAAAPFRQIPFDQLAPFMEYGGRFGDILTSPLHLGDGRVAATNGFLMVRLPADRVAGLPSDDDSHITEANVRLYRHRYAARARTDFDYHQDPSYQLAERVTWADLRARHPELLSPPCTRRQTCAACGGAKQLRFPDSSVTWTCEECEGAGYLIEEEHWGVCIGGTWFNWWLLERFTSDHWDTDRIVLNAYRCADDPDTIPALHLQLPDGWGDGFLMPVRRAYRTDDQLIHRIGWA